MTLIELGVLLASFRVNCACYRMLPLLALILQSAGVALAQDRGPRPESPEDLQENKLVLDSQSNQGIAVIFYSRHSGLIYLFSPG